MTTPEFCLDCRKVDPEFTKDGLTSKQLQALKSIQVASQRAERAMLLRAAGRNSYEDEQTRKREASARARRLRRQRARERAA